MSSCWGRSCCCQLPKRMPSGLRPSLLYSRLVCQVLPAAMKPRFYNVWRGLALPLRRGEPPRVRRRRAGVHSHDHGRRYRRNPPCAATPTPTMGTRVAGRGRCTWRSARATSTDRPHETASIDFAYFCTGGTTRQRRSAPSASAGCSRPLRPRETGSPPARAAGVRDARVFVVSRYRLPRTSMPGLAYLSRLPRGVGAYILAAPSSVTSAICSSPTFANRHSVLDIMVA
jgi:hypothetical protein